MELWLTATRVACVLRVGEAVALLGLAAAVLASSGPHASPAAAALVACAALTGQGRSGRRPPSRTRTPNHQLRRERKQQGWSLDDMVKAITETAVQMGIDRYIDRTTIWKWEWGYHIPCEDYCEVLCVLFQRSREELGLPPRRRF